MTLTTVFCWQSPPLQILIIALATQQSLCVEMEKQNTSVTFINLLILAAVPAELFKDSLAGQNGNEVHTVAYSSR